MPQTDKKQINITLPEEQKQRWEEYLEDSPQHKSMAQFIRFSVERQVGSGGQSPTTGGVDEEQMGEIADRTRKIQSNINQLQEQLDTVAQSLENPPEEIIELAGEVLSVLPTEPELLKEQQSAFGEETPIVVDGTVQTGRPDDIAEHLDSDTYRVRLALEQLMEDTALVRSQIVDGEERYYKVQEQ